MGIIWMVSGCTSWSINLLTMSDHFCHQWIYVQKLKAMEQQLLAMNWKPLDMDHYVQELQSRCEEQNKVIQHLHMKLDQQHQQRIYDTQMVEEKANRIKQWVAEKLHELEHQNQGLQSENVMLHEQVTLLHSRLESLPHSSTDKFHASIIKGSKSHLPYISMQNEPLISSSSSDEQNYLDYHLSDVSSEENDRDTLNEDDDDDDNVDADDDEDEDELEPVNDLTAIYYEIDENHESKYEPTDVSCHPPQVQIARKVFKTVSLNDSIMSSSIESNRVASVESNGLDNADIDIETENFTIENVVLSSSSITTINNSTIFSHQHSQNYLSTFSSASSLVKNNIMKRLVNNNFSTNNNLANLSSSQNIYMADDLSPCQESTLLLSNRVNCVQDQDINEGDRILLCTSDQRPQTLDINKESPPSNNEVVLQQNDSRKELHSCRELTESNGTDIFSFENLYCDLPIPVYATINGKATCIRNCPFSEDSSCESSDEELSNKVTVVSPSISPARSEAIVATSAAHCLKVTHNTTSSRHPIMHPRIQTSLRKESCSSIPGSGASSDYVVPVDSVYVNDHRDYNQVLTEEPITCTRHKANIEKSGYLSKLCGKVKTWKKRWFVLHGSDLIYYKSRHEISRHPQGVISLDGYTSVSKSQNNSNFEITNNKKTYYLAGDTSNSVDIWIKAIQLIIKREATNHLIKNTDSKVVHRGWLMKVKNGSNHRCWCELYGKHLVYYTSPMHKVPVSQVDVQGCRVEDVDTTFDSDDENDADSTGKFVIVIWRQNRAPIYLISSNQHEKDTWMYHLTVASGGGMGSVGTEFEQLIYKLIDISADFGSVLWKHPLMLYVREPISKPLTTLPSENLQHKAIEIFRSLLRFMCTPMESSKLEQHVILAQTMFKTCLQDHELHNEFYCQLIKQTSLHPVQPRNAVQNLLCGKHSWFLCDFTPTSPTSSYIDTSDYKLNPPHFCVTQAWQLFSLALALFLPKQSVLWLLRVHLQRNADSRNDIGKYAVFCQRALERALLRGNRKLPPSRMEVLSILLRHPYYHSQPISIPVHFANCEYQVISFDGSSTVSEFTHTLTKSLAMRESSESGFALLSDDPRGTDSEYYIKPSFKVCDVISKWEQVYRKVTCPSSGSSNVTIKFMYKNRFHYKANENDETERERLLLSYQINDDIQHECFPVNRDLSLELATLLTQVEYGDIPLVSDKKSPVLPPRSPLILRRSPLAVGHSCFSKTMIPNSPSLTKNHIKLPNDVVRSSPSFPHNISHLPYTPTGLPQQLHQAVDRFFPKCFLVNASDNCNRTVYEAILDRWRALHGCSTLDCIRLYLNITRKWPYCNNKIFSTKIKTADGEKIWLVINEEGLSLLDHTNMHLVQKFDYKSVVTFGGWKTDFMIVVNQLIESAPHHYEHRTDRIIFDLNKPLILEVISLMTFYINNRLRTPPEDDPSIQNIDCLPVQ